MIKYGKNTSFENVEVGDTFSVIEYSQYGTSPRSALDYTVTKAGKRDVICSTANGHTITVKRGGSFKNPTAFAVGSDEVLEARKQITLSNRKFRCATILNAPRTKDKFDAEFMEAIESWNVRVNKDESK